MLHISRGHDTSGFNIHYITLHHTYIYTYTVYNIYIYMYIYIYVYICIYLHHMFSITFSMWLAGAFLVRASVGRWVAAWLLLRSFRQNFISGGGIRLHPSHDHFDPFSIETEAHWTGVCGKKTGKPHILPSIHWCSYVRGYVKGYTLVAMENGPFIGDLPFKHGDVL